MGVTRRVPVLLCRGRWVMVLGLAAPTTAVAMRAAALSHVPVATPLDSAALFLWVAAAVFLALEAWYGLASLGAVNREIDPIPAVVTDVADKEISVEDGQTFPVHI